MTEKLVVHPLLFAVFPVLSLFAHNAEQLYLSEIVRPGAVVLSTTLLLFLAFAFLLRDWHKAGIISSLALVIFFSYGHAYDVVERWQIGVSTLAKHQGLMVVWANLLACGVYTVVRSGSDWRKITKVLNVVGASLVVFSLFRLGVGSFRAVQTRGIGIGERSRQLSAPQPSDISDFPDIYYIVLDSYPSGRTLEQVYGYDNSGFLDGLAQRGFYIASESQSNYAHTFLSLASSLNMEYVNYLADTLGEQSRHRPVAYEMIRYNEALRFLRSKGYGFVHFGSGWGPTDRNRSADLDVQCGAINEFASILARTSILRPFTRLLAGDTRQRVLCTFSRLAEVNRIDGPEFVFAHILPPHPPYLFDKDGDPVPGATLRWEGHLWAEKENYVNQLIFINKKVEDLVDEILLQAATPPIIVLQADHGTASSFYVVDGDGWTDPRDEMVRERFGILSAYYLPEECAARLSDSMTPVNTFRLIFSCRFDADYELLEDVMYYSDWKRPYSFIEVTDIVSAESCDLCE